MDKKITREQMIKNYEMKAKKWLEHEGFNEDGVTYIVTGDTFPIKDELKEVGFSFNKTLLWHASWVPEGYEDRVMAFNKDDVLEMSAFGEGHYFSDAAQKIRDAVNPQEPMPESEWLDGEKFSNLKAKLIRKSSFNGKFGPSNVYTFLTDAGNILTWFSATNPEIELKQPIFVSGTIKDRTEYKGVKQTTVTRVKCKPIVE